MPGLVPGIHVFYTLMEDVDGRDKFTAGPAEGRTRLPGHDEAGEMNGQVQKTALVTGAARGIGLATARRFLAEGFRVALLDIDRDNLPWPPSPKRPAFHGKRCTCILPIVPLC